MRSARELLNVELRDMTKAEQRAEFERDQAEIVAGRERAQEDYRRHTGNTEAPRFGLL
jgi:hypothetical protein